MRLIVVALIFSSGVVAANSESMSARRETLLARYAAIFAARTVFDEVQVAKLETDTRSYFYEREAAEAQGEDKTLHRLHAKLLLYLNFFQINIKARGQQLSDWNYYRLMLDAIRAVDHRYLVMTSDTARHYYDLLRDAATAHLWRAVRVYQKYFPFLRWELCTRVEANCPQQLGHEGWETIESVVAVLNMAVDRLNAKVEHLNHVATSRFLASNTAVYQQALRDYLHTYEELLAEPYGGLLLMLAERQHRKLLATPTPFSNHTLARLKPVDVETVRGLFAKIAELFTDRFEKLKLLAEGRDRKALLYFLLKYHRQVVAEFLINYPRFFDVINYYLDLVNNEYGLLKKRTAAVRRDNGFIIAGGVGLSYAALHHFFRFSKGQVLYFGALAGGAAATGYVAWRQKSLVDVFTLQKHVQAMHDSLVMQQSRDLLHVLHQLGQLARVRSDALLQGSMLTVYALFFVRHLRKAWSYHQLKNLGNQASILADGIDVSYQGFDLGKIGAAIEAYPDNLRELHITKRLALAEELFGSHENFTKWLREVGTVTDMDDLSSEHIEELLRISSELQDIFAPTTTNIKEITARLGEDYNAKTVGNDLDKVSYFIYRLFDIRVHGGNIPPSR